MVAVVKFLIKNEDYLQAVDIDEVYFFTSEKGKVIAVLENSKIELTASLYLVNELLGKSQAFFRCHKSFVVNVSKIVKISRYHNKTYNIQFRGIREQAYITEANLRILKERFISL